MSALANAVAAIESTLDKLATDNAKAFSDLQAAIAGGNQAEMSDAISKLDAINTRLQNLDAAAIAADATVTPPAV